ncbi:MAG: universal stress protein, partial [Thermodesulfobacteriota bacterium]
MQKILLAIDGMFPSKQMVDYAVDLCRRIRAELNILHIIDTGGGTDHLKKFQQQVQQARERFESTMMAASFAETGDHDTAKALMDRASENFSRLLSEEKRAAIDYRVKIKAGGTDRTILDYVSRNRDIVLAIYDVSAGCQTDE